MDGTMVRGPTVHFLSENAENVVIGLKFKYDYGDCATRVFSKLKFGANNLLVHNFSFSFVNLLCI